MRRHRVPVRVLSESRRHFKAVPRRLFPTVQRLIPLTLGLALAACSHGPEVILHGTSGAPVRVRVEVVNTPATRAYGLMYRPQLAADAGMLFVFPQAEPLHFWMKNTLISLDMIFMDRARRVTGVVARARPMSEAPLGVDQPSMYVLEVNAGFAAQHGIEPGAAVEFANVPEGAT